MKAVFTFGGNHYRHRGRDKLSLGNNYVVIEADSMDEARDIMAKARGTRWSMQYDWDTFEPQIEKYRMSEVSLDNVRLSVEEIE